MGGEPNRVRWRGVRPTDPEEPFTVKQGTAANLKVEAAIAAAQTIAVTQATAANLKATVCETFISQGIVREFLVNPVANDVVVDTGQLSAGRYDFTQSLCCTVDHSYFQLQHRDAPNTGHVYSFYFALAAYHTLVFSLNNWNMAADERIRIVIATNLTGHVMPAIWWTRRT